MSKELEILLGFTTKAYNKSEDEIKALILNGDDLKDNAMQALIDLDALKVRKLKDEQTKTFDNGYKKAQKEVLTDYEKKIKETLGLEVDLVGDEFIESIKTEFEKAKTTKEKSKLTDTDIKAHPVFIDYEKKWKKEKEEAIALKDQEFVQFKTGIERSNKISQVKSKAVEIFMALNPILPKDTTKAENQKNLFLQKFDAFDYEIPADGNIVVLKDGNRLETSNGYPVAFNDLVKKEADSIFEFQVQKKVGGTGNENEEEGKKKKNTGTINMFPKSDVEFGESLLALGNQNDKIKELSDNWKNYQASK